MKSLQRLPSRASLIVALSLLCLLIGAPLAWSQQATITPNYKEADIRQIVEAVGEVTGRNFIIDPGVNAKVTMLSSTPMSAEAFYEAFLSILQVHGYVAVTSGDLIKIVPDATARQYAGPIGAGGSAGGDDIVTQVVLVQNVGAAQLVPILRPLIPQYGHLAAHPGSNMLIISDRSANVTRMMTIIRRIDQSNDEDVEVVRLEHASAAEIVRIMTALTAQPRSRRRACYNEPGRRRQNEQRFDWWRQERAIATAGADRTSRHPTRRRWRHPGSLPALCRRRRTRDQAAAAFHHSSSGNCRTGRRRRWQSTDPVSVWADTQTNAIVINAPPKMMRSLMLIVDKLDIRRAQVLVEAIIVEVIADKTAELGVTWAVGGDSSNSPISATNFPDFGNGVVQLGAAAGSGGQIDPTGLIGEGITLGLGRISDTGVSFAAILRAMEADANTNIISTPSIVTTDNEEATLNVGQEVPFVTGSYSNTGNAGGAVNPFQTIQRQQIGVKLVITPQINEGNSLLLKISQEISNHCVQRPSGRSDHQSTHH